jgi:hypothetical protein
MMNLRQRQRGLGWFGLLFVFAMIGFVALVTMRCLPIYLNQMKIAKAIHSVAADHNLGSSPESTEIYNALQRYWDIDSIDYLKPRDVKVSRTDRGRMLSYKYEARAPLFYNISVVIAFQDSTAMAAGGGF